MKARVALVLGLLLGSVVHLGSAQAIVVHADRSGDFATIQDAIDAAPEGSVIELSNGTYTGDRNRDLSYLGKAITIKSQGGAANCIIDAQSEGPYDQHVGFQFISGEGPTSILEGVTITHGTHGIGVFSSPVIRDCIVTDNSASGDHSDGYGGGILCADGSARFVGCTISWNGAGAISYSGFGGGVWIASSPTFENCAFLSNGASPGQGSTGGRGGNIFCAGGSNPAFLNCTISAGGARFGAGVYCEGSTANFTGCLIADNRLAPPMDGLGAGAYCLNSTATFSSCTFVNNQNTFGADGMWCRNSSVNLGNCTFYGSYDAGWGTGVGLEGTSVATIENTIISFDGLAVSCDATSTATLTCCDLYGNADGGDWVGCIAEQAGVNGNISLDPLFCGASTRDFHLEVTSPCRPFSPPNPQCDLIGAWPVQCGVIPTKTMSWGRIKTAYR